MALTRATVAALLALANMAAASPVKLLGTEKMSAMEIFNVTQSVDRRVLAAYGCVDQSCMIADTSGSTGRLPVMKPEGASDADIQCIIQYNPQIGELLRLYENKVPMVPKQDTGVVTSFMQGLNGINRPYVQTVGSTTTGTFSGSCTANILIFAKGTLEPGETGLVVGPSFTSGLPSGWSVHGISYDPDISGDFCLGLPGGMVAKDVINQAAQKCPNSQIFVSGYSQGAMVIRNGLARATPQAKAKVKVSWQIANKCRGDSPTDSSIGCYHVRRSL